MSSISMSSRKHGIASVLACLATLGQLLRVQPSIEQRQDTTCTQSLGRPAAAFNPSGPAVRLPMSDPTPGAGASNAEKEVWLSKQSVQRSYHNDVVVKVEALNKSYDVYQFGALSINPQRYPLYAVMTRGWSPEKPNLLVTGGVHGAETSGIHGAILFLQTAAQAFSKTFNILVVPCVNPWGYETLNRENAQVIDPNRSFHPEGKSLPDQSHDGGAGQQTEESSALISFLQSFRAKQWMCHIDLHEQNSRRGFHLVSDKTRPRQAWHSAMISALRKVTNLARAEPNDIRLKLFEQHGVMTIDSARSLGMCAGMTNATYATTFEVHPEPHADCGDKANDVHVTGIVAALEYIINAEKLSS